MKLLIVLLLGFVLPSCTEQINTTIAYSEVYSRVLSKCDEWDVLCVPSRFKEAAERLPAGFIWGRFIGSCTTGSICWDEERCASEPEQCDAVLMHEIGHKVRCTNDEFEADAFVIENGTIEEAETLEYLICDYYKGAVAQQEERCAAIQMNRGR